MPRAAAKITLMCASAQLPCPAGLPPTHPPPPRWAVDVAEIPMSQRWPERLWIVRHGESQGNVARDAAQAAQSTHIDVGGRDVDVPLSQLGEAQSRALGHWFARMPSAERPEVIFCSPYLRAGRRRRWSANTAASRPAPPSWTSACAKRSSACSTA
jgi:hypothetical protein